MWELLYGVFCIILIYAIIGMIWSMVELKIYGKTFPNKIDDVVAAILSISLYLNFI